MRLAITGFAKPTDSQEIQAKSQNLTDLLTVKLSQSGRFDLIDRQYIDLIAHEGFLALARLTKPAEAIQVGRLLGADWLVQGSFLDSNPGSTNSLIVKVVDAHSGIIRDFTVVTYESNNLSTQVSEIADLLSESVDRASTLEQRVFISLGGFEDLSINNRYPNFRKELWTSLEISFRHTRFTVVERSIVEPLLEELRLNLGGLSDNPSTEPSAQPVFLLVDGVYQSYQDTEAKISLALRVQQINGAQQFCSFQEVPGDQLNAHVATVLGKALNELSQNPRRANRKEEALTQVDRGIERARLKTSGPRHFDLGGYSPGEDDLKRVKNISEAIEAFQSAILLEPENAEAKLDLAICLMDPGIGRTETGRDYLSEVIAGCQDISLVHLARLELARSYLNQNQSQALNLLLALEKETVTPNERAELYTDMLEPCYELQRKGKLSTQDSTKVWQGLLLAQRAIIECTNRSAEILVSPRTLCQPVQQAFDLCISSCQTNREAAVKYFDQFLLDTAGASPGFTPYLWSACAFWPTSSRPLPPAVLGPRLLKAWELCRDRPDTVPKFVSLTSNYLPELLELCVSRSQFQLGGVLAQIVRKVGLQQSDLTMAIQSAWASMGRGPGKIFYYAGYCDRALGNWKDALEDFQRGKNQTNSVTMDLEGPWGTPGTRVSAADLVLECQNHVAPSGDGSMLATKDRITKEPFTFDLGKPVLTLGQPTIFASDGPKIWLTDGFSPFVYDKGSDDLRDLDWPTNIDHNVTSICVGQDTVWWGTDGSGLVAMDKATRHCKVYSEAEQLILPYISALVLSPDRLWIGFGRLNVGGVGYLDLRTRKFVGLTPNLDVTSLTNRAYPGIPDTFEMPSRNSISSLCVGSAGELWFSSSSLVAGSYSDAQKRWASLNFRALGIGQWNCLVANSNIVALGGCGRASGLLIHDLSSGENTEIELRSVLAALAPNEQAPAHVTKTIAFDGDRLWVGGNGYLALVDPAAKRVHAICRFDQRVGVWPQRLEVQDDGIWVAINNRLYRLPRHIVPQEPGQTLQSRDDTAMALASVKRIIQRSPSQAPRH